MLWHLSRGSMFVGSDTSAEGAYKYYTQVLNLNRGTSTWGVMQGRRPIALQSVYAPPDDDMSRWGWSAPMTWCCRFGVCSIPPRYAAILIFTLNIPTELKSKIENSLMESTPGNEKYVAVTATDDECTAQVTNSYPWQNDEVTKSATGMASDTIIPTKTQNYP